MTRPDTAPNIVALGGINMALIGTATRLPLPGETLQGERFYTAPGGKGATQAVAAARLGANVRMVGRVGRDLFGPTLLNALRNDGIDVSGVVGRPGPPLRRWHDHPRCRRGRTVYSRSTARTCSATKTSLRRSRRRWTRRMSSSCRWRSPSMSRWRRLAPQEPGALPPCSTRPPPPTCPSRGVPRPGHRHAQPDRGGVPHRHTGRRRSVRQGGRRSAVGTGSGDGDREDGRAGGRTGPPRKGAATCRLTTWMSSTPSQPAMRSAAALAVALAEGRSMMEAIRYASAAGALAVTKRGVQTAMPSRAEVDALYQNVLSPP